MKFTRALRVVLVALSAGAVVSGCGTGGGSSSSRAHLYSSLEEMTADSDLVLTGTAGAQDVVSDIPGSTIASTVTDLAVTNVLQADDATAPGSTVVVRQMATGSGWFSSGTEAALEPGQRYLLFLVHSGLDGDAAADFYPVGAVAGIYRADGEAFARVVPDSGDDLPATLSADQISR